MANFISVTPSEGAAGVTPSVVLATEDNNSRYDREANVLYSYDKTVYAALKVIQRSFGEILSIVDSDKIRVNDGADIYIYGRSNSKVLNLILDQKLPITLKELSIYDDSEWVEIENGLPIPGDPGGTKVYLYRFCFTTIDELFSGVFKNYVTNNSDISIPFSTIPSSTIFTTKSGTLSSGSTKYIYGRSNSKSLSFLNSNPSNFSIKKFEYRLGDTWNDIKVGTSYVIPNDPGQFGDLYDFRVQIECTTSDAATAAIKVLDNVDRVCDEITLTGAVQLDESGFIFYDEHNTIIGRGTCPFIDENSEIQYLIENFGRDRDLGRNPNGINKSEYDNCVYNETNFAASIRELLEGNALVVTDVDNEDTIQGGDDLLGRVFKGINFVLYTPSASRYFIIRMPYGTHRIKGDTFDINLGIDENDNPIKSKTTSYILIITSNISTISIGPGLATTVSYLIAQDIDELVSSSYLANYQKFLRKFSPINPKESIAILPTTRTVYKETNNAHIQTYGDSWKFGEIKIFNGVKYICVADYTTDTNFEESNDWIQYEDI